MPKTALPAIKKTNPDLIIENLTVKTSQKQIINNLNLTVKSGEIHVIMGPNGSGKSTLLLSLMGHPRYQIKKGTARLGNQNLLNLSPDKRASLGLFLAMQNPTEIPGLSFASYLRNAKNAQLKNQNRSIICPADFIEILKENAKMLNLNEKFLTREVNHGFSGGEKKKSEILQMAILEPKFALLDEIDSGLDIDALKTVAKAIDHINQTKKTGIVLVTHYSHILKYLTPHHVHIFQNGQIIKSGGPRLSHQIEKDGFEKYFLKHENKVI